LEGDGRMAEPETILAAIEMYFTLKEGRLKGKKVLITAGPTYEALDPVRFIGNHSSGKMGFELASKCLKEGAEVILITGPTNLTLKNNRLQLVRIQSAEEMLSKVQEHWSSQDFGIFSAAVADYRPTIVSDQKIKKNDEDLHIDLVKNPDILAWAGQHKTTQKLVGFALETNNANEYGMKKLQAKNLDMIVINTLEDNGAGFAHDTNKISILDSHNNLLSFELKPKSAVAADIVDYMIKL
jgi:phosphopantothenoylcysteine decarboxylase/phosphopantothenate--cysteine ligase